jgi:hypothetical protein
MYPNQRDIEKKLFCQNCNKRFDVPKFLPCGETICLNCLNFLTMSNSLFFNENQMNGNSFKKNTNFNCPFCMQIHIRPQEDFPTNRLLLDMLNIQPTKVVIPSSSPTLSDITSHLNASIEMETLLNQLKVMVNDLKSNITTSEKKLKDNCATIRNKIAQNTTNIINEINSMNIIMLNEVDKYESNLLSCVIDPVKKDNFNIKDLLNQADDQLNKWYNLLSINKKTHINENTIRKEIQTVKKLEETLLNKNDIIRNFFALKEHLVFDDTNVKLVQSNVDLKSLIGTLSFKQPQLSEIDCNNNINNTSVKAADMENCKVIDYSKIISEKDLKTCKEILVSLFKETNTDQEKYIIGINHNTERQPQRYKTNIKLLDDKLVKLGDSINYDCQLIQMHIFNKFLIVLAYEGDIFTLNLYDCHLKLLKKQPLSFCPLYFNINEDGIYLLIKQHSDYQQPDSLICLFDWELNEVESNEMNYVLKKNRFYLNNTNDLFIINEKIYLVDKLNSMINIISCKNGDIIKTIYYNSRAKNQTAALPKLNSNNFLILINSFENVIVVDVVEKMLFILDSKSSSISQNIVYKKNLGFVQNISSLELIGNYVYMIHDKINKLIHIVNVF